MALHTKANLLLDGQTVEGEVENISMKGAFLTSRRQMQVNDAVLLTIDNDVAPRALCNLNAKVVRVTGRGMALQFERTLLG